MIKRNWLLGKRIFEECLLGEDGAEYGANVIKTISKKLTQEYGKGFTKSNLYSFYNFYKIYPNIFQSVIRKFENIMLSWTHYYCLLKSQRKDLVAKEMEEKTKSYQCDKLAFIKNPMITEFLGLTADSTFTETDLETSILSNIQKFLMELGKGYAFIARQQHIHTEKQEYYIDLAFYNYILKCFVLVDLKTKKITHQDVGQMDMYIRMYDDLKRNEGDNPTIGIVLCSETDADIAKYSIMNGNEQLFASKYKLYLPTEDELRAEIETQKTMFYLQQNEPDLTEKQVNMIKIKMI